MAFIAMVLPRHFHGIAMAIPLSREDVKLALPVLAARYSVVSCATCPEWAPCGLPNWVSGAVLGCRNCSPRSVRALGPAAEVGVVAGWPSLVEWLSIGHHEVTWTTPRLGVAVVFFVPHGPSAC